jgi:ubiquinone/menaquinone biosynthesis C-methylase UbiE
MVWITLLFSVALLGILLYWLLVTTEGVFLGRRMVIWLYDLTAYRYDSIKEFSVSDDSFYIARPMLRMVAKQQKPKILDVATGTGRVVLSLLREPDFDGLVIGLDASAKMLDQAQLKLKGTEEGNKGCHLFVQQFAVPLPFPDNSLDVVSCLEALEFFPSYNEALAEMVRVLKPGCALVTSRRRGNRARLYLNRFRSKDDFEAMLHEYGLVSVHNSLWELDYDMVTARKPDGDTKGNTGSRR